MASSSARSASPAISPSMTDNARRLAPQPWQHRPLVEARPGHSSHRQLDLAAILPRHLTPRTNLSRIKVGFGSHARLTRLPLVQTYEERRLGRVVRFEPSTNGEEPWASYGRPGPMFGLRLQMTTARLEGRSEERRVGKECRSRWSPYH